MYLQTVPADMYLLYFRVGWFLKYVWEYALRFQDILYTTNSTLGTVDTSTEAVTVRNLCDDDKLA